MPKNLFEGSKITKPAELGGTESRLKRREREIAMMVLLSFVLSMVPRKEAEAHDRPDGITQGASAGEPRKIELLNKDMVMGKDRIEHHGAITVGLNSGIPMTYARGFDTARSESKDAYAKWGTFVTQEIEHELASNLSRMNTTGEAPLGLSDTRITKISITGSSSPEAYKHESASHESVKPGVIDQPNVTLAEKRAREVAERLGRENAIKNLRSSGVNVSNELLEQASQHITGEEIQFSADEIAELGKLARTYGIVTPSIYHDAAELIERYNTGRITKKADKAALDKIVKSKRGVQVTIEYEAGKPIDVTIPAPIIHLGLSLSVLNPVREAPEPPKGHIPKEIHDPRTTPTEERGTREPIAVHVPEKIRQVQLPPEKEPDYQYLEWETLMNDLYRYFRSETTIQRGLDYGKLGIEMDALFDKFSSEEDRELYFSEKLLRNWREHDIACRQEAGWTKHVDEGLSYEENPRQIQWARMHVRQLLGAVQAHHAEQMNEEQRRQAYFDYIAKRVRTLNETYGF